MLRFWDAVDKVCSKIEVLNLKLRKVANLFLLLVLVVCWLLVLGCFMLGYGVRSWWQWRNVKRVGFLNDDYWIEN